MAVEFKSSMSKNELLEIAAEHGIEADDSMKKNDILKLLEQARAAEGAQEPQDGAETPPEVTTRRRATKRHRSRRTARKALPGTATQSRPQRTRRKPPRRATACSCMPVPPSRTDA
jgi:hypothetical protein